MEESKQIEEINVQESLKDNLNTERVEEQSKINSTVDSSIVPGVQESTKTDNSSNVPDIKESTKVESIDDSSKSTEVKESPKLSSAEKLAILRQRRANKILNSGGERLSKIVNSYSNDSSGIQTQNPISTSNTTTLATEGNQGPDAIVKPEPQSQSTSIDTDVKPELFSPQTLSDVKQEPQAEVPDILLNQSSTSKASAKSDINTDIPALTGISSLEEKELELPFLDEELEFKEPSPSDSSTTTVFDILGWVHGVSFTCLAVYTFTIWIHSHAHEMFASNSLGELDRWYHQICRQLEWMSSHPVHHDIGSSSAVTLFGYTMPIWTLYYTFEAILLSFRVFSIQMKYEKTSPYAIPASIKPFMIQFGMNPVFWESILGTLFAYYNMYNTFMVDMYLVIVLMGLAVTYAKVSHMFGACL